jgi:16S rRNA (cytidine1402-2'-O)-methyltransferase
MTTSPGTLWVCAGPIGNLGDAPPRLAEALASADVVYAEDTRRTRVLLDRLGVDRPLRSYFAGNEARRAVELGERLAAGETVALITDAGTPAISDPGMSAVRAAAAVGARVTGVPGPSAVTFALALSGVPTDRFVFEGFLPRRGAARRERVAAIGAESRTVVVFCAPTRLADDLVDIASACPPERDCVVARELTKVHEEVWRGKIGEAAAHWGEAVVRGEVTVVLGPRADPVPSLEEAREAVEDLIGEGMAMSEAVRRVAAESGVARRALYESVVDRR